MLLQMVPQIVEEIYARKTMAMLYSFRTCLKEQQMPGFVQTTSSVHRFASLGGIHFRCHSYDILAIPMEWCNSLHGARGEKHSSEK